MTDQQREILDLQETIKDLEFEFGRSGVREREAIAYKEALEEEGIPLKDTELYRTVYEPLFRQWQRNTGNSRPISFEELADFYVSYLRCCEDE